MDAPLKETTKLEKLSGKGKSYPNHESIDSLLSALHEAKAQVLSGNASEQTFDQLLRLFEAKKKEMEDRQKELYACLSRLGKALDKKFSSPMPVYSNLFTSPDSVAALERTISLHLLRTGHFEIAEAFLREASIQIPAELCSQFMELHRILKAIQIQDLGPALAWANKNRHFLQSRSSPLEFYLHRSQYLRLLLSSYPPDPLPAISYANATLRPFFDEHGLECKRLMACVAFLPIMKLQNSPYADLASPSLHSELEPLFTKEYCASLGMSRQEPLRIVGDIGGGGALARIEKGRKVMRERKSEWSQTDELPIEVPLPPENRYHSIFACPVSKEQATEQNPPMMMTCGHVINRDSLQKLSKNGGRVKCPYCPTESQIGSALRVYF
ncbi:CTLH/CRA C-terminal to LisH motif domain containing protein [Amanita muscaria]|uniref:GID complex catalytic subunit 2 n=1 Tax=Amanita muscaria (strain Koide BX008) TaxID=946122 RepID=A0A0C2T1L9_AMAMK|nr:hypothetical protein M378DRAFT_68726 [Amanita muscaria Koide BX008]